MRPMAVAVAVLSLCAAFGTLVLLGRGTGPAVTNVEPPVREKAELETEVSPTGPHPHVVFIEKEHNFGMMKMGQKGAHKFEVRNDGEAPLRLATGTSTCQCTVGSLGQKEVAPGQSTTIELTWEVRAPSPTFRHSAEIWTNDPANRTTRLAVSGRIGRDLINAPADGWRMGAVTATSEPFIGYIYSQTVDKFSIRKIETSAPEIHVEHEVADVADLTANDVEMADPGPAMLEDKTEAPLKPRYGHRLRVRVDSTGPVGMFEKHISVETDIEGAAPLIIPVSGFRPGPFQFFPLPPTQYFPNNMLIDLGDFEAGPGRKGSLLIVARDFTEELKLTQVTADPPLIKVSLEPQSQTGALPRYRLTFEIPEGSPAMTRPTNMPATVVINTNHPSGGELKFRLVFVAR